MKLIDLIGFIRCILWISALLVSGSCLTVIMIIFYPVAALFDPQRLVYQRMLGFLARINLYPYTRVTCKGLENIPNSPAAFICNHQSFVDPTLITYPLTGVSFKCLFKNSLIYAPGIGSTLLLSGHISVDRSDKNSARSALARAEEALNAGSNVVFFVEGTRKIDTTAGPLGDFKPGAFIAAQHAQVPLVPMTISGARRLFPPGIRLLFGDVTITVHPPLPPPVRGSDEASTRAAIDESISKAKRIIASGLREWDHVVADASGSVEHVKTVASGSSRSVGAAASKQSTPAAGSDAVPSVTSEAVKKD